MYFEQEAKIKAASDVIEKRLAQLDAIADAWNGAAVAPVKAWAYDYLPELAGLLDALTEDKQ